METIRKKISFNRLISHRNGISPYVSKENDDINIKYVSDITSESNYGSFPCDFALNSSSYYVDGETGLNTRKNTEISRLRYADVMRWYNEINKDIKNGVFLTKIDYTYENIKTKKCVGVSNPLENCGDVISAITESETVQTFLWPVNDDNDKTIFECVLVDLMFFKKYRDDIYAYEYDNTLRYKSLTEDNETPIEELPEEDRLFIQKMEDLVIGSGDVDDVSTYNGAMFSLGDNDLIFAINKYDEYKKYEEKWNEWWEENWVLCTDYSPSIKWEENVFDENYSQPDSLKFIYDIEKYVLGKVRVPEKYQDMPITGSKVPNCVYYLNYMDYLTWFNNNEEFLDVNEDLQLEWEKRGGDVFKAFLESIEPIFITEPQIPENGSYAYFGYASPNMEIGSAFVDEFYNEYSYAVYEYSVGIDGELVDATIEYECGEDGEIESALTPTFVSITDSAITVESKLNTLFKRDVYYINDQIYGVFDNFSNGGQLFSCTYHMGESNVGEVISCCSGTIEFYSRASEGGWNLIKTIDVGEKEIETVLDEQCPLVTNGKVYQVVGIKELYVQPPVITVGNTSTLTSMSEDGKLKTVSSITYYNKTIKKDYSWWECYKEYNPEIICGDGEDIDFSNALKYRNVLLLSCVPDYCEKKTGTYYYMAKYDNGYTEFGGIRPINAEIHPKVLKMPYTTGMTNVETYDGDFTGTTKYDKITNISTSGNRITIEYVLGATLGEDINTSGIHYIDDYTYDGKAFVKTVVDGYYNADVLYEKLTPTRQNAYSEDFDATREYIPSLITGMEIATQWTPESSLRSYLYTDDSFDNLIEYPNIGVDITFNRGNAAAWESHFKLSECNTFEDLQNYGNNYFNL